MREIRFRAWDLDEKLMHQVSSVSFKRGIWWCAYACGNEHEYEMVIKNAVLMQFTGLKDKNGKEIYEGDIITCRGGYDSVEGQVEDCEEPAIVSFDYGKWIVRDICNCQNTDLYDYDLEEVIGNIYENPELLGVK